MQAGDIVFVKPAGFFSSLVARFDGGPYSHVAMAINETEIVEAQAFNKSRITKISKRDADIMVLSLSESQRESLSRNAVLVTGRWYDHRLIFSYFLESALLLDMKALWNSQNNLICSELVATLLLSVGYAGGEALAGENITPRELFEHLAAYEKWTEGGLPDVYTGQ